MVTPQSVHDRSVVATLPVCSPHIIMTIQACRHHWALPDVVYGTFLIRRTFFFALYKLLCNSIYFHLFSMDFCAMLLLIFFALLQFLVIHYLFILTFQMCFTVHICFVLLLYPSIHPYTPLPLPPVKLCSPSPLLSTPSPR